MSNIQPMPHGLPPAPRHALPELYEPRPPELRQVAGVIWQRLGLGLAVAAGVLALVMLFALTRTPQYTAVGSVLIQPKRENLASAEPSQAGLPPDTSAVDTQVQLLRSHALAEDVVRRLRLDRDPEFNPKAKGATSAALPGPREIAKIADRLQARTDVKRAGLTYVVDVGVESASPAKAAQITNATMQTFLQRQLDEKVAAVSRANKELGASLESMRKEAEIAEQRVQEYKNAHGLFSAEGATLAEQEVSTLNQQIAAAKADTAEKQARLSAAIAQVSRGSGGADVGAALGSETIRELRKREAETSLKLAQLQADFKPGYPEVRRTQAQLDDVRHQIQLEINRILSSLRAEASAAAQRQGSLLGSRGVAQGGLAANGQAQVGLLALQQRAESAKQVYEAYLNRAKQVAAEGSLQQSDASIASPAAIPSKRSSPNLPLFALAGTLLGLLAGALSMLAAELWGRNLRSGKDVERDLGLSFAGLVPDYASVAGRHRKTGPGAPADYMVDQPLSSFAEALRNLRAFLLFSGEARPVKLLALTSAVPREGKSMTSFCLARALALSGSNVVVVDCDLRLRGLSKLMGEHASGIVQVVDGEATLEQALVRDAKTGLWVLPATEGAIPYDLFSRPECDAMLRRLAERFDYVLLDTPPVLGVADARIIAGKVDRVLYVVHWNKTPLRAAQAAVQILRESGADIAGALLTRVNVKAQSRYGYADDSDYFQYYRNYYVQAA
jgi:succinoglycan biosynthesis transport protein ExoP